jgi:D-ribose pyranase
MRKGMILNSELVGALAALGHGDTFLVCDAGFPIPDGLKCIDLALVEDVPNLMQVIRAILSEMIVEEAVWPEELEEKSPELAAGFTSLFAAQDKLTPQWAKFELMARQAKFCVRTGDTTPFGSILLKSASAVRKHNEKFDISF